MNLRSDAVACLLNHSEFKLTTKWINHLCTTLQPVVVATTTSSSLTLQCNNWQWLSLRKCPLCKRLHATWQIFWQFCSYESSWWHLVIVIALVGVGEGSHRHGDKSASFFAWVEWLVKVRTEVFLCRLTAHTREGGTGHVVIVHRGGNLLLWFECNERDGLWIFLNYFFTVFPPVSALM